VWERPCTPTASLLQHTPEIILYTQVHFGHGNKTYQITVYWWRLQPYRVVLWWSSVLAGGAEGLQMPSAFSEGSKLPIPRTNIIGWNDT
jgi:hypothetical protein